MNKNIEWINVGSDFSGVGAFDQALRRLGIPYKTVFSCDMDKYARQTYVENYGEPAYYPENVYDREIPKEPLDIYMTSPPCQAFSLAGKRKGEDDKRGILFYNSHEFIQKNNPRYFIIENVKGLLSDDSGKTFQRWIDLLGGKTVNGNELIFPHEESVPYHVYWKVINAKHHGVPQNRERVFIIGIRDDSDNNFMWPKEEPLKKKLKDVLEENVDEKYYLSEKMLNGLIQKSDDSGYINQDTQASQVHSKEKESPTISAGTHGYANGYVQVKSATSKGYETAVEGDSINLSQPESKTRRGRVGKEVAQTLDTSCNQAVMIAHVSRSEEGKKARKKAMSKGKDHTPFQAKQIEFKESDVMNCITTATTKDNLIKIAAIRGRGKDNQQQLEVNESGVSNALTTVQKDNVVVINSNKNRMFDGNNNNHERNTIETLSALQKEIGEEAIKTWGLRILETIREKDILQSGMHESRLPREAEKISKGTFNKIQQGKGSKTNAYVIMRSLSKETWEGCSPQRRKSIKQLIRQLNESLQELSPKNSQTKVDLQSVRKTNGWRLGILQQTLFKIQEIWESVNGETQPVQRDYRIRKLTPREAFRLMDFPDTFLMPCSSTQMYKQAGNSIVVGVLAKLISKLNLPIKTT